MMQHLYTQVYKLFHIETEVDIWHDLTHTHTHTHTHTESHTLSTLCNVTKGGGAVPPPPPNPPKPQIKKYGGF